jgi:hypothetical protein
MYPCVWSLIVGDSSVFFKSSIVTEAVNYIRPIEDKYTKEHRKAIAKKKDKDVIIPRKEILLGDEITLEAIYESLHNNKNGVLLENSEFGSSLKSFDRYVRAGEKQRWLNIFDSLPIKYVRKTNNVCLYIKEPFCSIVGATTPESFNEAFIKEDIGNGFLARFLLCVPTDPLVAKEYFQPPVDERKREEIRKKVIKLQKIPAGEVKIAPETKAAFEEWYKVHSAEKLGLPNYLRPFWCRLEAYALKFALLFHLLENHEGDICPSCLKASLSLVKYYKGQCRRAINLLQSNRRNEGSDLVRQLVGFVSKSGGVITRKGVLQKGPKALRKSEILRNAIEEGVNRGVLEVRDGEVKVVNGKQL